MDTSHFISARWRIVLPIYMLVLVVATTGAYLLAQTADDAGTVSAANLLHQSRRAFDHQAATLYEDQQQTAQSISVISGVSQVIVDEKVGDLRSSLETRAGRANLDALLLLDENGHLVWGVQRRADGTAYVTLHAADAGVINLPEDFETLAGVADIQGHTLLYTAVNVQRNGQNVGAVLVGQHMPWVLATLHTGAMVDAVLFDSAERLLASTLPGDVILRPGAFDEVNASTLGSEAYWTLYFPFVYGGQPVGLAGVLLPENVAASLGAGRQIAGLALASLAASAVLAIFIGAGWLVMRVGRVTRTVEALAQGERTARTNMEPTDEIGRLGQAVDRYAEYAQERQDALRASLRRQRRENERLLAVLEALPDGVIVQDLDGRVIVINETARVLLGSRRLLRSNPDLQELTAFVTDQLGPAMAPGLFKLGEPQHVRLDQRILSAQAAAVMSATLQRIGTVIVLRDMTEQVQAEAARAHLLRQMETEVQEPLSELVHGSRRVPTGELIREIRQHTGSLQKMILEMREMTETHLRKVAQEQQRPLLLETLVWAVANEWRQVAQAQNLRLHVMIEKSGLYVLGEERRLRWAMGNIIDNAIKYTPSGGDLTLEVQDDISDGRAHLRVRDNGVGIARDELPHVFNRFYRGKPVTREGRVIRVPGSGQGLTIARQIFEAHGGSLTIKSKQWTGTAVYFTIPLTSQFSLELPRFDQNLEEETVRIDTRQVNQENERSQK